MRPALIRVEITSGQLVWPGIVPAAWDAGIRYFDTAPHYGLGLAEERLGEGLRAYPRDEYVVSTKVGRVLEPNPDYRAGDTDIAQLFDVPATRRRRLDYSRDGVLGSVEDSLTRLGLDRIDILFVHDPDKHEREALEGATFDYGAAPAALLERVTRIADTAEAYGVTVPQLAVQFPLRHPAITTVVLGADAPEQITRNAGLASPVVPSGLWEELEDAGLLPS
jgi:aryl-alcohol dehydrogenase-like predicted oxidoreductase